jgi:DNA-binding response OmpR family regulator
MKERRAGEPCSLDSRRILLVEDDPDIARLIDLHLSDAGALVEQVADGVDALARALQAPWDLILLDIELPGIDGMTLMRQIRRVYPALPVLLVTARGAEADRVEGLDAGADDYIVKPFSMVELVARVRASIRRAESGIHLELQSVLVAGDLILNSDTHSVSVAGKKVDLTAREFALLGEFVKYPGKAFRRTELLERVWGSSYAGYRHTVNTHINRLRAKIEPDTANPTYIKTVWGVGYRLDL